MDKTWMIVGMVVCGVALAAPVEARDRGGRAGGARERTTGRQGERRVDRSMDRKADRRQERNPNAQRIDDRTDRRGDRKLDRRDRVREPDGAAADTSQANKGERRGMQNKAERKALTLDANGDGIITPEERAAYGQQGSETYQAGKETRHDTYQDHQADRRALMQPVLPPAPGTPQPVPVPTPEPVPAEQR